jgi:Xaa-Pro aminopeptidase
MPGETREADALDVGAQLERRRREVAARWDLTDEVVVVGAGEPVVVPGRGDRTYPFRAHSEYFYLTDRERPGGVLAFDPGDGWVDFVAPVTRDERLWEGATDGDAGVDVSKLASWLDDRKGRPVVSLGAPAADVDPDERLRARLRHGLNHVRRPKDELELSRMRTAERATRAGFAAIGSVIEAGRTEREVQIELEAEFFRAGADFLAFESIVAGGPNSAVLHFPPSARPIASGELVLVDAGAEYKGYASDVTRTYAVSHRFTPEQEQLYSIVDAARMRAIECCVVGTEWRDIHRAAALVIAEGLAGYGLLRGEPESLVEQGAQSVFFPHGVGHMVGLGVRDAGEVLPGRETKGDQFPRLRMDLPLERGFAVTIEPGIYLVPALLHDAEFRERYSDAIDWDRAEEMEGFGGIRIEDNVVATDDAPEVLTQAIPRTL